MASCRLCGRDTNLYDAGEPICTSCSDRLELRRRSIQGHSFEDLKQSGDEIIAESKAIREQAKLGRVTHEIDKKPGDGESESGPR
jgi:hypothetical protein